MRSGPGWSHQAHSRAERQLASSTQGGKQGGTGPLERNANAHMGRAMNNGRKAAHVRHADLSGVLRELRDLADNWPEVALRLLR